MHGKTETNRQRMTKAHQLFSLYTGINRSSLFFFVSLIPRLFSAVVSTLRVDKVYCFVGRLLCSNAALLCSLCVFCLWMACFSVICFRFFPFALLAVAASTNSSQMVVLRLCGVCMLPCCLWLCILFFYCCLLAVRGFYIHGFSLFFRWFSRCLCVPRDGWMAYGHVCVWLFFVSFAFCLPGKSRALLYNKTGEKHTCRNIKFNQSLFFC